MTRTKRIIIAGILLLFNSKTWNALSKASDVDFLVTSVNKAKPHMTELFLIFKDWGWVVGLVLLVWALKKDRPVEQPVKDAEESKTKPPIGNAVDLKKRESIRPPHPKFSANVTQEAFARANDTLYALDEAEAQDRIAARNAVRVLERFYMALASHREHVENMKWLDANRTDAASPSNYIDVEIVLDNIRKELIDQSPRVFPTSVAMDFQKPVASDSGYVGAEDRILPAIDDLMKKVRRQWGRYGEQVGITPMKFRARPIVKLDD